MTRMLLLGGNDRSLHANRGDLIQDLLNHEIEVHAALPASGSPPHAGPNGIPVHRLPMARIGMNPLADLRSVRALERLFAKLAPQAVLAYNPKPVIHSGLVLMRFPDIRYVAIITGRGALERRPGFKGMVGYQALSVLYGCSLYRADVILFQNPDDKAYFRDRFVAVRQADEVDVIPGSGVNVDRFSCAPLPESPVRFLLVAKLLIDKGVREFVDAARMVRARLPDTEFRVVGGHDPALPHALPTREVERWKREGMLEFTGHVTDVRPHLCWSTVLCHPSYAEGTPRAVLEAMATGRPIITTDAPGCWQTIEDGKSGRIVKARSSTALAEAMIELARARRSDLEAMGRAAWVRAREVYDVRKVNARIMDHLRIPHRART